MQVPELELEIPPESQRGTLSTVSSSLRPCQVGLFFEYQFSLLFSIQLGKWEVRQVSGAVLCCIERQVLTKDRFFVIISVR
jgi:hypothetical protein